MLLLTGVVTTTSVLSGQTASSTRGSSHEVDLALTYTAINNSLSRGGSFWQQGGGVELSGEVWRGLGVTASVTGARASNITSGVNLTTITTVFGPRYAWTTSSGKIALFGQGLIGEAHGLDSVFPSPQGALSDYISFALQAGGGVDLRLSRHFAVRAVQADWLRTQFPNAGTNVQNNLRISGGLVLRLQR
ncbi:hypothetical protein [Terriglobus sp. RCC_193]|uniref:hypothetical protein n=1 Tax=Terriglobus sp. RCC_193 TaxID=3239218 RepID=UPI003524E29F